MAVITGDTKYEDIRLSDRMPNGDEVVEIHRDFVAATVKITTQAKGGKPVTYGAEYASETYGAALARAEYMQNLTDHS